MKTLVYILTLLVVFIGVVALSGSQFAQETPTLTPLQPTLPAPTAQPELTQLPTPTRQVIVITPTMVNIPWGLEALPKDFAEAHWAFDKIPGVKLMAQTVVVQNKAEPGQKAGTAEVVRTYAIDGETCNNFSQEDGVALTYLMAKKFNVPYTTYGPLIATESRFIFFLRDSNGTCKVIQNYAGAPAYCAGQIYGPNGSGMAKLTHPSINLYPPTPGSNQSLQDPVYCIDASVKIYAGFVRQRGDLVGGAAGYKGFDSPQDAGFVANYMATYKAQGVWIRGVWYAFNDNAKLEAALGPERLGKAQNLINTFYK